MTNHTQLQVQMNDETAAALRQAMTEDGITATEAVRRAISVYDYLRQQRTAGHLVTVNHGHGREYALELL